MLKELRIIEFLRPYFICKKEVYKTKSSAEYFE